MRGNVVKSLSFFAFLVFIGSGFATMAGAWTKIFGGPDDEYGNSVQQTSDGGYIVAGTTSSFGTAPGDVYLIKTDSNGNEQWSKTFGGSDYDEGISVQQTSDNGYIIIGHTKSYGAGGQDVYLIKTDSNGNEQWSKTFGGKGMDFGDSVRQTTDGGYIIACTIGSSDGIGSDMYLIKTDSNGNEQWSKMFGGMIVSNSGESVQQTTDGGYIIAGKYRYRDILFPNEDIYLIKTDSNGNEQWSKMFGGPELEGAYSVQQTSDGGYIIVGERYYHLHLIKTDSNGNEQWSKIFSDIALAYSVQQTSDGGYIIAGNPFGLNDIWLIKTDSNGNEQWSKTFVVHVSDWGESVQQTSDGGYIIAGHTEFYVPFRKDVFLIKTDSNGNE